MAKPNFTLPNKPAIKSGSILSYNYTDDFTFVPAPLTFNRDSAATRVNEKGLIEDVGYFGPELIQNGDFSEIGEELVTNGDFSTSGTPNTSSWSLGWYSNTNNVIISDGKLTMTNSASESDARAYATNGTSSNNIITTNKFYKLQYDIVSNNGVTDFRYYSEAGVFISVPSVEVGSYTIYIRNTSNSLFLFQNRTSNSSISIDNVSVKEVGQNWTFGTDWSVGNNKLIGVNATTETSQVIFPTTGIRNLKISFDVVVDSGSVAVYMDGETKVWITSSGSVTRYVTSETRTLEIDGRNSDAFNGYITNISVIEVLGDKPRIDYSDSLTEPSLLLEPQSTNLIEYSENFNKWTKIGNTTITATNIKSPSGENNATNITGLNGSGTNDLRYIKSGSTANKTYTYSVYLKGSGTLRIQLSNGIDQGFDDTITLTPYWKRHSLTSSFNSTNTPNLTANLDDLFGKTAKQYDVWGAQLEELSYPTSYIPTAGATATRLGETANNAGDVNVFNSEEGVLYAEIAALANDETNREITLSDGTTNNYVLIRFNSGGSNRIYTRVDVNTSVEYFELNTSYNITDNNKIAIRFKNSDFATFINGTKVDFQLSGNSFPSNTLNKINFDNGGGFNKFHGKVKNVQVFNKALTDRELEILTIQ